ncbi:putative gustatory receptor 28b [Homalodisca vitripennis]|uniref:putative gustatory receptor 28b n=1 Tax=Homalodisca vitripennis TaxID=197043 RepID=UPI001EEBD22B|nr:putative gustatory receptor 28b [Homalodisca vitripennis]
MSMGNHSELLPEMASTISLLVLSVIIGSILMLELVSFINYTMKYSKFLEVCTILETFDYHLQLGTSEYRNTVNVSIIVLSTITPTISQIAYMYWKDEPGFTVREILACIFYVNAHCGRIGLLIHFQQVSHGITERLRFVNDRIRLEVLTQCFRRTLLRQNPLCANPSYDSTSSKKVRSLISAYHLLCGAVGQANVFYSDLLLASIFCTFLDITEALYLFLLYVDKADTTVICTVASSIFHDATFLVLVTLSGSGVSEAAGETAPLVCKLISQDLGSELREELKSFLLQLANQTMEFSAGGFFQINRQTLTSMIAAVTTYLVIMIQFDTQSN